ncbi:MAG: biotin/lipoyl-binding protein [Bacteroidota bacterium]|nr:biotin/lipoyl-binding protein [Bacteroidota bacterium]
MRKLLLLSLLWGLYSCQHKDTQPPAGVSHLAPTLDQVVGIGKIQPEPGIIDLSAETNGIVERVYKHENDTVSPGDLILELDHSVDDAMVMQLQKQIAAQAAQVKADQAAVKEYEVRYQSAATKLDRLQHLLQKGAETQQDVDNARTDMLAFEANWQKLSDIATVSESKLAEDKAQLEVTLRQRDQKLVRAPVKGTIILMDPQPGSAVDTRVSFGELSPAAPLITLCEIDELFASRVHVGQKAYIRNPGSADTLATGTVYFASSYLRQKSLFTGEAGEKEDRRVRVVKILLDHPHNLLINSRVECVIEVKNSPQK